MKKEHIRIPQSALVALAVLAIPTTQAAFSPVALTAESFSWDVVVEQSAPRPFVPATTASVDGGTNNTGFTWYEQGYNIDAPDTGIPVAGSTFSSESNPDYSFALAASYTEPNAVLIDGAHTNVTLTFTAPAAYSALSFLASSGNGAVTVGYTVQRADGTTETGTFESPDWFNAEAPVAFISNGRVDAATGAYANVDSGNPKLFAIDVTLSDSASPISAVELTFSSGGATAHAVIFAVSGSIGAEFTPIAFTGFNQDVVVESTAAHAEPLEVTTATLDGGAENTGATWYERGYNTNAPDSGLPPAGTTLTNAASADSVFQMPASYTENNAALVDISYNAVLTPATPAAYTALSFLASSGQGSLTADVIITHQDGSTQNATLTIPDWFNNSPYAFVANGRVNVENGSIDAVGTENPRLYAIDLALENTSSPVTNIEINYNSGDGHALILAVSGASGVVAPIFDAQPASVSAFSGSEVSLSAAVSGPTPITYQWQKQSNGGFANVTDGGVISGATTTNLLISSVSSSHAGNYILIASNAGGSSTSLVAALTILSSGQDVTAPGDEIISFGGTSPGAEEVINAIDDTTSKYLNFGTDEDQAAPFVGPVGLIVTPSVGPTTVTGLRIYTANDAVARDPVDYILEGSNDGGETFTVISSGALALPDTRNAAGLPLDPLTQAHQEIVFANSVAYTTYRLTFTNVKDNAAANSMQIGEIELLSGGEVPGPEIAVSRTEDGSISISWTGQGTLQSAPALLGAETQWTDVGTTSPVTVPTADTARFFRLVVSGGAAAR